ncbi:MAG: hypothetical protein M0P69_01640 [Bacteroidales bacterium]|nr:hypothetical protein [Bacteroidales bacterium]
MKLVHKDGVMVMVIDGSADGDLIATLKAQGWSEPSYYCKDCGEVPVSKGLCSCFGKQGGKKMKYSIGDRVIVKERGEKGIVVKVDSGCWCFCFKRNSIWWYSDSELLSDLTAIEKPFGLLSKEVQDELKAVDNGKNILFFDCYDKWAFLKEPKWGSGSTYRLNPNWKAEEVKEMTVGEIEAKLGHKVKVVK